MIPKSGDRFSDKITRIRAAMLRIGLLAAFGLFGALAMGAAPGTAATWQPIVLAQAAGQAEPLIRQRPRRARPRLRVNPRYPYRRYHSVYPIPYTYEYPGPNAKRHCVSRYVTERRPSGPVIVPRMRCWWAPG
jgi:hypothetical protein